MYLRKILFLYFICSSLVIYGRDAIYVSPSGTDVAVGTFRQPVQTLDRALVLSRNEHLKLICLKKGDYYDVGITLTPADSGLTIRNYKNDKVTLYGGKLIRTFTRDGKFLVASLPAKKEGWDFRMLLVDGEQADRSRLPEAGFFQYKNVWNVKGLPALYGGWVRKPALEELTLLYYAPNDIDLWKDNLNNGEISMLQQWDESYTGVAAIDSVRGKISLTEKASMPLGAYNHHDYVVWNTREGVTRCGQWYWDKISDKIYYWPKAGQNVGQIIVPSRRNLITLQKGTKNITIEGVSVSASSSRLQNESFACSNIDAAITGNQVTNIHLDRLNIVNTGGNAIRLKGSDISISHVCIKDCGGGGIYFSGKRIHIADCRFQNMGTLFSGAVGIRGDGANVLITHCSMVNVPYSGICLGCDSCKVEYCTIQRTMTTLLDGAAIYCGSRANVDVLNNFIVGNNDGRFTVGIYFDEQSRNCKAENNVVVNSGIPVHCHLSQNILYCNNLFIDKKNQRIQYGGSSNIQIDANLMVANSLQCTGPSINDAEVDTLTLDPKFRKYANPSGISSFQNNLLYLQSKPDKKGIYPNVDKTALAGTQLFSLSEEKKITVREIVNKSRSKGYFDKDKLSITRLQWKEIERNAN